MEYLRKHLAKTLVRKLYVRDKKRTLLGAIPALTVSLVSSNTIRRISCTHSSAEIERVSQYGVILGSGGITPPELPFERKGLLEISFITSSNQHIWIVTFEYTHNLIRHFYIFSKIFRYENEVWTKLLCNETCTRFSVRPQRLVSLRIPAMPDRTPYVLASYDAVERTPPVRPTCPMDETLSQIYM
jgi:hypothetical protein